MGLEQPDLEAILRLRAFDSNPKPSLGILGDCQFHFNNISLFNSAKKELGSASATEMVSLSTFAKVLGFRSADTLDLFGNPTIKLDLQEPLPPELISRFDWIIDAGTAFCCFDVAAVLRNTLTMLKDGGTVVHISALTGHFGRGAYYSFHPATFADFYSKNGCEISFMASRVKPAFIIGGKRKPLSAIGKNFGWVEFPKEATYLGDAGPFHVSFSNLQIKPETDSIPNNALLMCVAKKLVTKKFEAVVPKVYG